MSTESRRKLEMREVRKRRRERIAIGVVLVLIVGLTFAEIRLTKVSSTLPFVNSIFFFGILNINLILLMALVWLIVRNVGKIFIERRSKVLGARLKTKLVVAFLAFSIIPTLVLFLISSLYINSSFDKWFSLKVQNTLQASLDITGTYYRNTDQTAMHFASQLSKRIGKNLPAVEMVSERAVYQTRIPRWIEDRLKEQRELLALDAVEFYSDPLEKRSIAQFKGKTPTGAVLPTHYPRLSLELLEKAFTGEKVSVIQHVGNGDLIRCLVPVFATRGLASGLGPPIRGVGVVNSYMPVTPVTNLVEIASVIDDYQETNPLKYPLKTTYFLILVMMTLVIIFAEIWLGLYLARELTVPVERLVRGVQAVGAGNLDIKIETRGQDEIGVLVESFNKMTRDLKENQAELTATSESLEQRRMQLEAVLANVGTGVIVVDQNEMINTFNRAAAQIFEIDSKEADGKKLSEILGEEATPLKDLIRKVLHSKENGPDGAEVTQWNFRMGDVRKYLAGIATILRDEEDVWGVVVVIDDMTHMVKGQREMAWREVARRIAHEIKNPLTPIKLSAQRLQRRLGHYGGREGALLKECTETIVKHTDELKEMVNEFSSFARFPEVTPEPNDLNLAVNEVLSLYTQAHPHIRFDISLETKLPTFEFDRDQLKRVIINLLDNAVAALDDQSNRTIECKTHYNDRLRMAVITVKDSGPGMSNEILSRVFEPYYSTKKGGAVMYWRIAKRIVNDHDGFIRAHSAPGQGTEFLIELPTTIKHQVEREI